MNATIEGPRTPWWLVALCFLFLPLTLIGVLWLALTWDGR
jgi:hypothetical protein